MSDAHTQALDAIFKMRRECMDAAHDIRCIARALGRVGMSQLSEEMYDIAQTVETASQEASEAYAGSVSERANESEQASRNMVKAFMVGVVAK